MQAIKESLKHNVSLKQIAKELGRTESAVKERIEELRMRKRYPRNY